MPNETLSLLACVGKVLRLVRHNQTPEAIEILLKLPKGQAMLVTAYTCDQLHGEPSYGGFLRQLERFL